MKQFTANKMGTPLLESYLRSFVASDKKAIITAFFKRFGVVRSPVIERLWASFYQGVGAGIIISFILGLIFIPASVMMNANVHHHWVLRIVMGILGAMGSIFTIIFALIFMRGRHFFGILPITTVSDMGPPPSEVGWAWYLFRSIGILHKIFLHPFHTDEDMEALKAHIAEHVFPNKPETLVVSQDMLEMFNGAKEASMKTDNDAWKRAMIDVEKKITGTPTIEGIWPIGALP